MPSEPTREMFEYVYGCSTLFVKPSPATGVVMLHLQSQKDVPFLKAITACVGQVAMHCWNKEDAYVTLST